MRRRRSRPGPRFATAASVVLVIVAAGTLIWIVGLRNDGPKAATESGPTTSGAPGTPSAQPPGVSTATGLALGVYVKPGPANENPEAVLGAFESSIGHHLAVVQTFTGWKDASGAMIPFPTSFASYATSIGATPMITWQPEQAVKASQSATGALSDQPSFSLAQLSSGRYDNYIRSWADQAKAYGRTVYVRPMHEMNDKTYPWSIGVNGNADAQQYIDTWRHLVGIFQAQGATNVQFVWCVGAKPVSPDPTAYFPGDSYVSWIALDGYNRGTPWESFTSIFSTPYREITAVSTRPVMIAETGTVEEPGDPGAKASWIISAFDEEIPNHFPRIHAVLYFDAPGRGFSYALSSSGAALQAFNQVAASPQYQSTAP